MITMLFAAPSRVAELLRLLAGRVECRALGECEPDWTEKIACGLERPRCVRCRRWLG